jgi:hypothetical protein
VRPYLENKAKKDWGCRFIGTAQALSLKTPVPPNKKRGRGADRKNQSRQ